MAQGHWSAAVAAASMMLMSILGVVGLAATWWTSDWWTGVPAISLWTPTSCGEDALVEGSCSYFWVARLAAILTVVFGVASASMFTLAYSSGRKVMHAGMGLWALSFFSSLLALGMGSGLNSVLRGSGLTDISHNGAGWICQLLASGVGIAVGILLSFNELSWPKAAKKPASAAKPTAAAAATPPAAAEAPRVTAAAAATPPAAAEAPRAAEASASAVTAGQKA